MTWVILIGVLAIGVAIWFAAKKSGERKKAKEVMERENELDREEANNELEDKRDTDAWDNLNDTIDG
jgi:hypothetical protein